MSAEDRLAEAFSAGPIARLRAALGADADAVWVVGGALRDVLLGRPVADVDLAVANDSRTIARAIHSKLRGDIFSLSDRFGTWRVLPEGGGWQIDVSALRGATIEDDLALRDFSVNAMAAPLTGAALVDPHGGRDDLRQRRMRVLGRDAYDDDPLRPLRLPRLCAVLGFTPDDETIALTREFAVRVPEASPERVYAELRALIASSGVVEGVVLLERLGLMEAVLPELAALRGVEQSVYHHLDAYEHTIEVLRQLLALESALGEQFGRDATAVAAELARPLADEMSRGEGLRWSALLHDVAKSETRTVWEDGRVGFPAHDERGAEMVRALCRRLRTSERVAQYLSALTHHHLRLGYLVNAQPLSRYEVYRYLRSCDPVEVEVGVLSVADRRATRGRKADESIEAHMQLARELNAEALAWRARKQDGPIVRGDVLIDRLGVEPGPRLGELLEAIAEAHFAHEIATAEEAVSFARRLLDREGR